MVETGGRQSAVVRLCEETLALSAPDRGAFLDKACQGDPALRREVESLLVWSERADRFLDTPAAVMPLAPGTRLGHFEIDTLIGSGGMGQVYRARDTRLGRTVAIKVLLPGLAVDPEHRRRFQHEARAASALNHPNICAVYDVGSEGSLDYLVMELLDGETLNARLRRGPLPLADAVILAEQIADALDAAHRQGIVHRDLKPGNVFLATGTGPQRPPQAKLLDFGLAKLKRHDEASASREAASDATLTTQGRVLGTPEYMSPEQLEGHAVDARGDIWALGATLYEMVTGKRAFEGDSQAGLIAEIMKGEPASITRTQPLAPRALDRLVRWCLAKAPADRPATAGEVANELARIRDTNRFGRQVSLPPLHASRRGWLAVVAAAAAIIAGAVMVWQLRPPPFVGFGSPSQLTSSRDRWEDQPAFSTDGAWIAYVSADSPSGNPDIWTVHARSAERGDRITNDAALEERPAWLPNDSAIIYASNRDGSWSIWKSPGPGLTRTGPELARSAERLLENARDPAISRDGKWLAFVRPDADGCSRVHAAALDDLDAGRQLTKAGAPCWAEDHPSWSPDGREICFSSDRGLSIVDVASGATRRLTDDDEFDVEPTWSDDGTVTFTSFRGGLMALWRVRASGRGEPERLTRGAGPERNAAVSPDGRRLVFSSLSEDPNIVVKDALDGTEDSFGTTFDDRSPAFLPDASAVVFLTAQTAEAGTALRQQPLAGWKHEGESSRLVVLPGASSHPQLSADGKWIAYFHVENGRRSVWAMPWGGGSRRRLTDGAADEIHPAWSPPALEQLAFASARGGSWNIWALPVKDGRRAGEPRRLTSGPGTKWFPAWSPNGRWIAFTSRAQSGSEIWNVDASGASGERRITSGADAYFARWIGDESLAVAGTWGGPRLVIRKVSASGTPDEGVLADIGYPPPYSSVVFDIARDGRHIAFSRVDRAGDLFVSEAVRR